MILGAHGLHPNVAGTLEAVRGCVGVQTQYAASLPSAVAARTSNTKPGWDYKALQKGDLIKSWTIRSTIHVHEPEDYQLMLDAIGDHRRKRHLRWMDSVAIPNGRSIEDLEERILGALDSGPLTRQQIHDHVPEYKGMPMVGWGLDVMGLAYLGRLVMLTPEKGATQFKKIDRPECRFTPHEAVVAIMRRYFETHGPATLADFTYWAGLGAADSRAALKDLAGELQEVEVTGFPGARFVLKSCLGQESKVKSQRVSGLRFLAKFDPIVMGFKDKTLFLDANRRDDVFRPAGQVEATVLENGKVTGTWRLVRVGTKGTVVVYPFHAKCLKDESKAERQLAQLRKSMGLTQIDLTIER